MQDSTKVYHIIRRTPPGIRPSPLHLLLFPSVSQDSRFLADLFWKIPCLLLKSTSWLVTSDESPMVTTSIGCARCHHTPFVQFLTTVGNPTTSDFFIACPSGKPETRSEMTVTFLIFHIDVTYLLRSFTQYPEGTRKALLFPPFFIQQPEKINDKNQIKLVNYILLYKPHIAIS